MRQAGRGFRATAAMASGLRPESVLKIKRIPYYHVSS